MSKYNARKYNSRGEEFDSVKEYTRYRELLFLTVGGQIRNLRRQVKYELIPAQYIDGKCVERSLSYIADFVYEDESGEVVEDVKGFKTPEYVIKRKLMLYGSYIVLAERDGEGNLLAARMGKVDGEIIKPDTWYMLLKGKLQETSDEEFNDL